jgi:type III restriction enzyme
MNLAVDQPILNNPFEEPTRYWIYQSGQPYVQTGRRPAGYYFKARRRPDEQTTLFTDEQFVELTHINQIRHQVKQWREKGYPGVTPITRQLLEHWNRPDRERRLFFCQREAAETIIYLVEVWQGSRSLVDLRDEEGNDRTLDRPLDPVSVERGYKALRRYGCKMATGSGKTVVMAMIAAWSVLNKTHYRQRKEFSDAVLVVCPNLTVKERLQVLKPSHEKNYYQAFDLVPPSLMEQLGAGKFLVTNWHAFAPEDDSNKRSVVQRGEESEAAFCNRVLHELGSKQNILVLNDEAHHAYRPKGVDEAALRDLSAEEKRALRQDEEEATVWVSGLDKINRARGINCCVDVSATPFYIKGSGYPEGSALPWLVSDFGLVDAIESGIVKIPRVPVDDNTGQIVPGYFALWDWIMKRLPAADRGRGRKPKPEAVLREADGALKQLAGEWRQEFERFQRDGFEFPPCLIVVCNDTSLATVMHEYIAQQGAVFPELLQNRDGQELTIRIDSKLLAEAEAREGESKQDAAAALRQKVNTVGKVGEAGERVRCVVSVGMLTEGWDAQNVTQILGLRAFQSQLLCEQVVGRGLRRANYNFEFDENGVPTNEEYVDVYGIPFEVIPVKRKPVKSSITPKESTLVKALPEREHLKIEFPRVEGFVFEVRQRIKCDVDGLPKITVEPAKDPTETIVRAQVGYAMGAPSLLGAGGTERQTRQAFYESVRLQQIEFAIARRVTHALVSESGKLKFSARHLLFPQVLSIVRDTINRRVDFGDADRREIGLEKYVQQIVERLCNAIEPDEAHGETPLLPRIERFRPKGSTSDVLFRTVKPCKGTMKSHVSHVALDTKTWESSVAYRLEQSPHVVAYVKNDHLDFAIPYDFDGHSHNYYPDYLIRLSNGVMLILEVKGYEDEVDRQKYAATRRWVSAVNNWGQMGRWEFAVVKDPKDVPSVLARYARQ